MGRAGRSLLAAAALAMLSAPAPAGAQRLQVEAGKWNVDYGNVRCSLARRLRGPQSPVLILTSYLGRDEPELILMKDGAEPLPSLRDPVEITLNPSERVWSGVLRSRRVQGGSIVTIQELGEGFLDQVAAAATLVVNSNGRRAVELPLPDARAGIAALRTCNDDLLRSWGVTPDTRLTRAPKYESGRITNGDYPNESIRNGESGAVVARLTVQVDGRVANCGVAVSSGHQRLDALTCALLTERFRFEPALDAEGRPTAALAVQTVRWMLPDD